MTVTKSNFSVVIDNSQGRTVVQRPRPDDNYLPYADSPAVAADMLLRRDGVHRVRLGVAVEDGADAERAMIDAGREVRAMVETGGSYFA